MLVRFLKSGPVKAGPVILHGLPGQIADIDGEDLAAAIEAGMVEKAAAEKPAGSGRQAKKT